MLAFKRFSITSFRYGTSSGPKYDIELASEQNGRSVFELLLNPLEYRASRHRETISFTIRLDHNDYKCIYGDYKSKRGWVVKTTNGFKTTSKRFDNVFFLVDKALTNL